MRLLLTMTRATLMMALAMWTPPAAAVGQECEDDETLDTCWDRLYDQGQIATRNDMLRRQALVQLYGKTVGTGAGVGGALGSAIEDFLPLFAGAVAVDRESPDDAILLGFDANLGVHRRPGAIVQPPNFGGTLRLSGQFREAQVFQPMLDSFPQEHSQAIQDSLLRDLDDLDDLSVTLSWNRESRTMGRSLRPHSQDIDRLFSDIIGSVPRPTSTRILRVWQDRIQNSVDSAGTKNTSGCDYGTGPVEMHCLEPDTRAALELAIATDARRRRDYMDAVDQALETVGFDRIVDLVNNQPQLNVSAGVRLRGTVVGPNDYSIRVRYETSRANLNELRDHCNNTIEPPCYRRYVHDPDVAALLRDSDRFWVSGELHVIDDFVFDRAFFGDNVVLALDGSISLSGEAGYGQYLQVDSEGNELARLDVFIRGEVHEEGSGRQDNWDATITYTQRVSEAFSIPISLNYSNKHETLHDLKDLLKLNLGMQYRLHRDPPD